MFTVAVGITLTGTEIIIEYKIALDLSNAFKARDYGKQRVYEKYRTL